MQVTVWEAKNMIEDFPIKKQLKGKEEEISNQKRQVKENWKIKLYSQDLFQKKIYVTRNSKKREDWKVKENKEENWEVVQEDLPEVIDRVEETVNTMQMTPKQIPMRDSEMMMSLIRLQNPEMTLGTNTLNAGSCRSQV